MPVSKFILSTLQACNLETNLKITFSARILQEFPH